MRKFILGSDWWTDCDDAVAIRLITRAHKAKEIELLGIVLNGCMECSVASLEGFLHTEGVFDIPIGIDLAATDFGGTPSFQKRLSAYAEKYTCNEQAEDPVKLYRRLLAQSDTSVELVEIGHNQVLAALLQSTPDEISDLCGLELVKQKVLKIWVMAGKWDENPGSEYNFNRNERSRRGGRILCELSPVPITFLGYEVGVSVISGGKLKKDDPLYHVLCDHGSPHGRCSWDPMLCLLAVIGDENKAGYKTVCGRASVDEETGENRFVMDEKGLHTYVVKGFDDAYYAEQINKRIQ